MPHARKRLFTFATLILTTGLGTLAAIQTSAFASGSSAIQPERARSVPDFGKMLTRGLNNSEGCLKVITADTSAGTNTIIAWFENKAAVERWYYSNTHKRMMEMVGSRPEDTTPMEHVKDADAPVMVMASITPTDGKSVIPGQLPVSQISIELYRPLDAGASVNGRLMPKQIELEHFREYDSMPEND